MHNNKFAKKPGRAIRLAAMIVLFHFTALLPCLAQPAAVQKAGRSVFSLTTFRPDGTLLASSHGVFIGENGEAVSSWKPFVGAARATIIDADGNEHEVEAIYGTNELYDICKFRASGHSQSAQLARANIEAGQKAWLVGYSVKKASAKQYTIRNVETFGSEAYGYYIFDGKATENVADCPFVNQSGEVIGLCQLAKDGEEVHATDVRFAKAFETKGLTINDAVLRQTNIRVAIPNHLEDARLMLMMAGEKKDTALYAKYISDFTRQFPQVIDGYSALAGQQLYAGNFHGADMTMQQALAHVANRDEAHSAYASIIMQQQLYLPDSSFTEWSLPKAFEEAQKANELKPEPVYQHQLAQISYAMGNYQQAYDGFMALTQTPIRNGELFFEAAQCRTQLGGTTDEIHALLDSAIAVHPDNSISAPYYLARGRMFDQEEEYRKAVRDYNKYDSLLLGRCSDDFYYVRYKAEIQIRQYQQALNDIAHAIVLNRQEPTYYAEMASLQLRVGQYDNAIQTADLCIEIAPSYSDPYVMKGVALGELGRRTESLAALEKARELGNERADGLIEKYKK